MSHHFFHLFRKRGFHETMTVLSSCEDYAAVQADFFQKLIAIESYPNTFFRVKKDMLKHQLIAFKLDENNDKVVYLTPKGQKMWQQIETIEQMFVE